MDNIIEKLGITKEPWKIKEFKYRGCNKVNTHEIHYGKDEECVAEYVSVKADAQLITKAPEMLEALIQITKELDNDGRFNNTVFAIGEVIQKATNKSWKEVKGLLGEVN